MKAIIFSNGEFNINNNIDKFFYDKCFIVCCDGALNYLYEINITPNIIIGDLDSVNIDILNFYKEKKIKILKFPTKKDFTDTELALEYLIDNCFLDIIIFGALGKRLDHSLANIHLLFKALKHNINLSLVSNYEEVRLIDKNIVLSGKIGDVISLFPLSEEVSGIYTFGLEYPIINGTLSLGDVRGISNVFINNSIEISISSGFLLVILTF